MKEFKERVKRKLGKAPTPQKNGPRNFKRCQGSEVLPRKLRSCSSFRSSRSFEAVVDGEGSDSGSFSSTSSSLTLCGTRDVVVVAVEDRISPKRRFRGVVGTADVEADIDSAAGIYDNVWIRAQGQTRFSTV
jgi:hypothetical protein